MYRLTRRGALAKLGIAATVAYTAPTILQLDRSANAKARPSPCTRPGRCGPRDDRGGGRGGGGGDDSDDDDD